MKQRVQDKVWVMWGGKQLDVTSCIGVSKVGREQHYYR